MGNNISNAFTPPPLTLRDCIVDGRINLARYVNYCKKEDDYMDSMMAPSSTYERKRKAPSLKAVYRRKRARVRSVQKHKL